MKNRKRIISTLIGMALTSQMLPSAYSIVANAQEPMVVKGQDQQTVTETTTRSTTQEQPQAVTETTTKSTTKEQQQAQQTELANNHIILGGNGCQETKNEETGGVGIHQVKISFDTADTAHKKLAIDVLSGYPDDPNHPFHRWCPGEYIRIELIGENGKIKQQFAMSGYENIGRFEDELNKWEFEYGDSLRIHHGEANGRTLIQGTVLNKVDTTRDYAVNGVSKDTLKNYQFKITPNGLEQVPQNIEKVSSASDLVAKLQELEKSHRQATIKLTNNINLENESIKELVIPEGVTLMGYDDKKNVEKNVEIDLKGKASVVLKGNYSNLSNLTIKNSSKDGVQVYNSKDSSLTKVYVNNSEGYGIFSNGSNVRMQGCNISKNKKGGIFVSGSLSLQLKAGKNKFASSVKFMDDTNVISDTNQDNEKKYRVTVRTIELVKADGSKISDMQENSFSEEYKQYAPKYQETKRPYNKVVESSNPTYKTYMEIIKQKYPEITDLTKVIEHNQYYN